jgi:hypothetical protein
MTAGKPKDRLAKRGKNLDPQHLLWENGKFTIFHGKKTFFSGKNHGKKTTIFGMAETDGFICCGTKAGGGKGKLGTQLLSKWGTGFFGIGKSGNSFLFINRR